MNLCNIFKNKTNEGANVPIYVKNEIEDLSSAISVFKESDFNNDKKTYIVDTNVIIQNPRFMTDFNSCNIILPIIALEELEKLKGKMGSNSGYRSRKFIRMLKESKIIDKDLINGVDYINDITIGTVFKYDVDNLPDILDKNYGDNKILGLDIFKKNKNCCLLTADISMAVKATAFGISVEIYDKGDMGKVKDLESGYMEVEVDEFIIDKAYEDKFISYNSLAYYIKDTDDEIFPNKYFIIKANNGSKKSFLGRFIESEGKIVKLSSESDKGVFYGMSAKDVQQKFMIDALLDDSIKLLTVTAEPGSGKSYVSLAVGMELAIEQNKYDKLLIGKNTAPLDNWSYQGFVPGTQEDKLMTHFANYMTTLENLEKAKGSLGKKKTKDSNIQLSGKDLLLKKISEGRLEMLDIASILGSSFEDKFIIIDEAQGFDAHAMRSIITRVGKGCKLVIIGDLNQQVISHLDPDKSGLFCAVEWLKELDSTAHITLKNVHRGSFVKDVAGIFDRKMFS